VISVILPTYNRESTIENSVRSVLDQTVSDLELIIVDDGSTDNTKDIIESLNDTRIRYIYQENMGACAARNKGIDLARGSYIAFHDSDDIWHTDKLEKQIITIKETGADILFCQMQRCNMGDGTIIIPNLNKSGFINSRNLMVGISTQTLFMKAFVAKQIRFDRKMPRFQDLEWLIRAVKQFSLYGIKEVLVDYYFSENSISMSSEKLLRGISRIWKKNPTLENENPEVFTVLRRFLIEEGLAKMVQNKEDYAQYLKLAFSMSSGVTNKIKYIMVCLGLFKRAYTVRHCMDKIV